MHKLIARLALAAVVIAAATGIGAAAVDAPQAGAAAAAGLDLHESYTLLVSTYYSKVDPQRLLDGARDALDARLHKAGIKRDLPALRNAGDSEANIAQISAEIARAMQELHDSQTALTYAVIDGMAKAVGDRWTMFFTPQEYKAFNEALDPKKISGIGVLIQQDPQTKTIGAYYVVPGTPADKAGLQSGDEFLAIDGVSTKGMTQDQAVKRLRGKAGTDVHLQIARDGKTLPHLFSITRSEVQPPTVIYKMLSDHIGYIYVLAFGLDTAREFNVALDRLQQSDAHAYVLDLRYDGGGYVNAALQISDRFVSHDPLLTIEQRGQDAQTIVSDNTAIAPKPMTVLVNKYTASASEITAGALQDDGIAQLVGEKTFGKGVMQTLTPLPGGAAIKITTAHYLTPKNHDINLKGIEPNVVVSENKGARLGDPAKDAQLQAAITLLEKKIADSGT